MAFATVQTADTKSGTVTTNSNSWTLTYPTNIASGDLLLACLAHDGGSYTGASAFPFENDAAITTTWPSGWQSLGARGDTLPPAFQNSTSAVALFVSYKIAIGTESGNFTATLGNSDTEQGGWRVFRITDWFGSSGGITTLGSGSGGTTSSTPNPPSVTPSWGADDTLWVAAMAADTSRTVSAFPTNYTTTSSDVSGGAGGATLGVAFRSLNAASQDPGTFTISANDDWACFTVAIRPAAAAVAPWTVGIPIR